VQMKRALEHVKKNEIPEIVEQFVASPILPDDAAKYDPSLTEKYEEGHRTMTAQLQDDNLPLVRLWLDDPSFRPAGLNEKQYKSFQKNASRFWLNSDNKLYRKSMDGQHKLKRLTGCT
jgi:hypothetical protein